MELVLVAHWRSATFEVAHESTFFADDERSLKLTGVLGVNSEVSREFHWASGTFRNVNKRSVTENGGVEPTYYSQESVGIAVGLLLAALHNAGLATLTHTPSPMKFLQEILGRPKTEVPFVLIPVGYPAENAKVPDIKRKTLEEIMLVF